MSSVVYFAASNGLIKIGTTANLERRIETLRSQSAAAVHLLGCSGGDIRYERAAHDCLSEYRRHGEWFVDCAPLRQVVYTIIENGFEAAGIAPIGDAAPASATVAEAIKLADLIVEHSGLRPHEAEQHFGLPTNSIWSLRYRSPKYINADIYLQLIEVAALAISGARARLDDDQLFVAALHEARIDRPGALEEIEAGIAGLRARLRATGEVPR